MNSIQKDSITVMHDIARFLNENTKNMHFDFNMPKPSEMEYRIRGYKFKYILSKESNVYTLESITKL